MRVTSETEKHPGGMFLSYCILSEGSGTERRGCGVAECVNPAGLHADTHTQTHTDQQGRHTNDMTSMPNTPHTAESAPSHFSH